MEYLDMCDEEGNLTGIKISKNEAHEKGFWHRSVHIWIINSKNELLIQKRSPLMDSDPNKWDISVAGHVSTGEDNITAALREASEELGLGLSAEDFILIGTIQQKYARKGFINNEINPIYVVRMDLDLNNVKKQEEEVSEVKYISGVELKKIIDSKDTSFVSRPKEYELLFKYLKL
ncbi:MAG: NUDIX domain-containing protein [Patescibacteria group bacterium]|nr:NUDIX domain-containing protein [Patescibacteria group bacterium]